MNASVVPSCQRCAEPMRDDVEFVGWSRNATTGRLSANFTLRCEHCGEAHNGFLHADRLEAVLE